MQMSAAIYIVPKRTPMGKQEGENHAGEMQYGFMSMGVAEDRSRREKQIEEETMPAGM